MGEIKSTLDTEQKPLVTVGCDLFGLFFNLPVCTGTIGRIDPLAICVDGFGIAGNHNRIFRVISAVVKHKCHDPLYGHQVDVINT